MCLTAFSWKQHPDYQLILLANRDEFYNRSTEVAHIWKGENQIVAGKDVQAGGTWMGINKHGKFAAITNYRDLSTIKPEAPSRGKLTLEFLEGDIAAREYIHQLTPEAGNYNGFNLLIGDRHELWYLSNVSGELRALQPGLYGLSNHLLDTPWPKVVKAKNILSEFDHLSESQLLQAFGNRELAPDNDLPDTGVGQALERKLSAMFIHFEKYGTRCTTLLTIDYRGRVRFRERTFYQGAKKGDDALYNFTILS